MGDMPICTLYQRGGTHHVPPSYTTAIATHFVRVRVDVALQPRSIVRDPAVNIDEGVVAFARRKHFTNEIVCIRSRIQKRPRAIRGTAQEVVYLEVRVVETIRFLPCASRGRTDPRNRA